jgi:hypothetical protein
MALALTNKFKDFFKQDPFKGYFTCEPDQIASQILGSIIHAPWMSSGLTANNAFTTTLVIRTFGFLEKEGLLSKTSDKSKPTKTNTKQNPKAGTEQTPKPDTKEDWHLLLGIRDVSGLTDALIQHSDRAVQFLWLSLTDKTRDLLEKDPRDVKKVHSALAVDIARVIEGGWIYDAKVFGKASAITLTRLDAQRTSAVPNAYKLAQANHLLLVDQFPQFFAKPVNASLGEIARSLAATPDNFTINKYPASAPVLYWFVDGVSRARLALQPEDWTEICNWATKRFNHERSLVSAEHDAMMDPVAMGMAACLCARLRSISEDADLGTKKEHVSILPSMVELHRSIFDLMRHQADSGIFPKYFPMFHYQDAGSNFCFTFELLEAVLNEFGDSECKLLASPEFIEGLSKAITWCEDNWLPSSKSGTYTGWNSGGYLDTLEKEQPESWATAVVHMFLSELDTVISARIQQLILAKYKVRYPSKITDDKKRKKGDAIDKLLEIKILLRDKPKTLSDVLKKHIIGRYLLKNEATLRREPSKAARSALLFGPPGTSKTKLIEAIASDLEWPMLELTPSEFVKGSLANIYVQADEIFEDLMDLSGVVVFFDEMDALVQTREGGSHLDIESQFLTTTMLPKLTRLYDQARVIFFMATNYQDRFDPAIKRPGRFDLLLCMGPPTLKDKTERLHIACSLDVANRQTTKAGVLIRDYLKDSPSLRDKLELFTFGEYKAFLKTIRDLAVKKRKKKTISGNATKPGKEEEMAIGEDIEVLGKETFCSELETFSKFVLLKVDDLSPLKKIRVEWTRIGQLDKRSFTLEQLKKKDIEPTLAIRYFCDRKESRDQS